MTESNDMTNGEPVACSLNASDLQGRLVAIAAVGADSLTGRTFEQGRHVLRFRADRATRQRLDAIVTAEADCCSFLQLALTEDEDGLVLTIAAPEQAREIADQLALAFG